MPNLKGILQDFLINKNKIKDVRDVLSSQAAAGQKLLNFLSPAPSAVSGGSSAINQTSGSSNSPDLYATKGTWVYWQSFTMPDTYFAYKGLAAKFFINQYQYGYFKAKITDMDGNALGPEKTLDKGQDVYELNFTWLNSEVMLKKGQQFKIWVQLRSDNPWTLEYYLIYQNSNIYAGGQASLGAATDFKFQLSFPEVYYSLAGQLTNKDCLIIYDGDNLHEKVIVDSVDQVTGVVTLYENLENTFAAGSIVGTNLGNIDTSKAEYTRMISPDLGDGSDGVFNSTGDETWDCDKNFTSITINSGHTISVIGNIKIKCQGDVLIAGVLSAKGKGFAGGQGGGYNGLQGYSYAGTPTTSSSPNYGGGGGGTSNPGGGGGGGYATQGNNAIGSNIGYGGGVYNVPSFLNWFETLFIKGSGGGGASQSSSSAGAPNGGAGGGIIRLYCKKLIVTGEITADGDPGGDAAQSSPNKGGGGGGAGGTIFIQALLSCQIGSGLIHALGGRGGISYPQSSYTGGAGGNGRIRIECPGSITGTANPSYVSGFSNNSSGYSKKSWYLTAKVNTLDKIISAFCSIKQKASLIYSLLSSAAAGQKNIAISLSVSGEEEKNYLSSDIGVSTGSIPYDSTGYAYEKWQGIKTPNVSGALTINELAVLVSSNNGASVDWKLTNWAGDTIIASGNAGAADYNTGKKILSSSPISVSANTKYKLWIKSSSSSYSLFWHYDVSWRYSKAPSFRQSELYMLSVKFSYTRSNPYQAGQKLVIYESDKTEVGEIDSIASGVVTLKENLINSYSSAAKIFVLNSIPFISLSDSATPRDLAEMQLGEVEQLSNDYWRFLFSKTIKATNDDGEGIQFIGSVESSGDPLEYIHLKEINWSFF